MTLATIARAKAGASAPAGRPGTDTAGTGRLASLCPAVLLGGAWLHAALSRLPTGLPGAADDPTVAAMPLEWVVAAIALRGLWRDGRGGALPAHPGPLLWPAALMLPVPGTIAGTLALLLLAIGYTGRARGAARTAPALFLGLAGCLLWWTCGERLTGGIGLRLDAAMASTVLGWVLPGVTRDGAVFGLPGGHRVAVLTGCGTLHALPLLLVALAAFGQRRGIPSPRLKGRLAWLVLLYGALNVARLAALGWSAGAYAIGHGSRGLAVADMAAAALVLLLAPMAPADRSSLAPLRAGDAVRGRRLGLALACLAALAGLWRTGANLGVAPGPSREARAEAVLEMALRTDGWRPVRRLALTAHGAQNAVLFERSDCAEVLTVAVVPRPADTVSVIDATFGPRVMWLQGGTLRARPLAWAQTARELIVEGARRLTGTGREVLPLVAVGLPAECPVPRSIWPS